MGGSGAGTPTSPYGTSTCILIPRRKVEYHCKFDFSDTKHNFTLNILLDQISLHI